MKIVTETISLEELRQMAAATFGNMVKAVVDIDKKVMAVDAELHSDLEALLLDDGSQQNSLWGINLYPDLAGDDFIEFDSMINVRPSGGNMSRGVENKLTQKKIAEVINKMVQQ